MELTDMMLLETLQMTKKDKELKMKLEINMQIMIENKLMQMNTKVLKEDY